jgi:uncharacterized protein (TIGR03435 family)
MGASFMFDLLSKTCLRKLSYFAVLLVFRVPSILGQTNTPLRPPEQAANALSAHPAFEVTSVKPSNLKLGGAIGIFTYPGGKVMGGFCTFDMLMMYAFDMQPFQISGGPDWVHSERYDIVGLPPASSKSSTADPPSPKSPLNEEQRQMLQALLIDRFQLKFHRENRIGPVYLLVKSGAKLKLRPAKDKDDYPWAGSNGGGAISGDGIAGKNISMPLLATRLSRYLDHPVLDQTGLKGSFDFEYVYTSDDSNEDLVTSILTSVQGIGLKLKPAKGPVETVVIDHVESPSVN